MLFSNVKKNNYLNHNIATSYYGFYDLGIETVNFTNILEVENQQPSDIVCGTIKTVLESLDKLNIERPPVLDYPDSLKSFLGRDIFEATFKMVYDELRWPLFIKPKNTQKFFTGHVIKEFKDLLQVTHVPDDMPLWVSQCIHFISEYRGEREIMNISHYKGDWAVFPNADTIKKALHKYESSDEAPIAYAMDFGVTTEGETLLVEVNDFFSLGNYGLHHTAYAGSIQKRWNEIIGD